MTYKQEILIRIYLVLFVLIGFAFAIIGKAFYIQVVEGDKWRDLAAVNSTLQVISGERGNLYSSDGHLLNTTIPVFDVYFDTRAKGLSDQLFNSNLDTLAYLLSNFNNANFTKKRTKAYYKKYLTDKRNEHNKYVSLFKKINYDHLATLQKFPIFNLGRNKGGFIVNQKNDRFHPFDELASRTIGSIGKKDVKALGIEGYFDRYLTGVKGTQVLKRVTAKTWVPVSDETAIKAENGQDIVTTINIKMQDVVHQELEKALYKHNAKFGSAILMDIESGAIRAMANLNFNEKTGAYGEYFNNAVGARFEQGSTFKLVSLAAMLESGKAHLSDNVAVNNGTHEFCSVEMHDASRKERGTISLEEAFKVSSNVGLAKKVIDVFGNKPDQFFDLLHKFEIDQPTGISIKGEQHPEIVNPDDQKWSDCITLPWLSIGYSADLSVLQLLKFYNTVANDGIAMNPFLVYNQQDENCFVNSNQSKFGKRVINENTAKALKKLLRDVVTEGTAKSINFDKMELAGKTGTSKVYNYEEKKYEIDKYHASFIGFFPYDNPKYSCAVVISETESDEYYGSQAAAPVFKNIAENVLYLDVSIQKPEATAKNYKSLFKIDNKKGSLKDHNIISSELTSKTIDSESKWVSIQVQDSLVYYRNHSVTEKVVPNVVGMGLRDAIYILENAGLKVLFTGRGKVVNQSIKAGENIEKGKIIKIELT